MPVGCLIGQSCETTVVWLGCLTDLLTVWSETGAMAVLSSEVFELKTI